MAIVIVDFNAKITAVEAPYNQYLSKEDKMSGSFTYDACAPRYFYQETTNNRRSESGEYGFLTLPFEVRICAVAKKGGRYYGFIFQSELKHVHGAVFLVRYIDPPIANEILVESIDNITAAYSNDPGFTWPDVQIKPMVFYFIKPESTSTTDFGLKLPTPITPIPAPLTNYWDQFTNNPISIGALKPNVPYIFGNIYEAKFRSPTNCTISDPCTEEPKETTNEVSYSTPGTVS
jgi:hypothetical protein